MAPLQTVPVIKEQIEEEASSKFSKFETAEANESHSFKTIAAYHLPKN